MDNYTEIFLYEIFFHDNTSLFYVQICIHKMNIYMVFLSNEYFCSVKPYFPLIYILFHIYT